MVAVLQTRIVPLVSILILVPPNGKQVQAFFLLRCSRGLIGRIGVLIIFIELRLKIDLFLQVVVDEPADQPKTRAGLLLIHQIRLCLHPAPFLFALRRGLGFYLAFMRRKWLCVVGGRGERIRS